MPWAAHVEGQVARYSGPLANSWQETRHLSPCEELNSTNNHTSWGADPSQASDETANPANALIATLWGSEAENPEADPRLLPAETMRQKMCVVLSAKFMAMLLHSYR